MNGHFDIALLESRALVWPLNSLEGLCLLGSPCIAFSAVCFSSLIHFYSFQYSEFMWRIEILEYVTKQYGCKFHSCKQNTFSVYFFHNYDSFGKVLYKEKGIELEKKATYFHLKKFFFWERERVSELGWEGGRRGRENPKQTPYPVCSWSQVLIP